MVVRVKICGLTRRADVRCAVDSGADALGFIFGYHESPRNLNLQKIKELIRNVPPYIGTVVVTPATNPDLETAINEIGSTFVQVYGGESKVGSVNFHNVIQTVRPVTGEDVRLKSMDLLRYCSGILLDTSTKSPYSNGKLNGVSSDLEKWKLAKRLRIALDPFPLILSGGLNSQNVGSAIRMVRPFAVDVSSGVEAKPGIKDEHKMRRFVRNSKSTIT